VLAEGRHRDGAQQGYVGGDVAGGDVSEPGFCTGCSKRRDDVREGLCPACWAFYYPEARPVRDTLPPMLKTFVRSLIPTIDALASQVPEVRVEALALAAKMRAFVGDADPSVGPGDPDPG
jgi:hypothetical protein